MAHNPHSIAFELGSRRLFGMAQNLQLLRHISRHQPSAKARAAPWWCRQPAQRPSQQLEALQLGSAPDAAAHAPLGRRWWLATAPTPCRPAVARRRARRPPARSTVHRGQRGAVVAPAASTAPRPIARSHAARSALGAVTRTPPSRCWRLGRTRRQHACSACTGRQQGHIRQGWRGAVVATAFE